MIPFPANSDPFADMGRRLLELTQMPGYHDLQWLSEQLVQEVVRTAIDFPGWDKDQQAALCTRMKAAKEHHVTLFRMVREKIEEAQQAELEKQVQRMAERPPEQEQDEADALRRTVLEAVAPLTFEEGSKILGSY